MNPRVDHSRSIESAHKANVRVWIAGTERYALGWNRRDAAQHLAKAATHRVAFKNERAWMRDLYATERRSA